MRRSVAFIRLRIIPISARYVSTASDQFDSCGGKGAATAFVIMAQKWLYSAKLQSTIYPEITLASYPTNSRITSHPGSTIYCGRPLKSVTVAFTASIPRL